MESFDFFAGYCCAIIFIILFLLTFVSLSSGSVTYGAYFGFGAVIVIGIKRYRCMDEF